MRKSVLWGGVLFAAGVMLAVAANYHFVYGSEVEGITVEKKPSLSLSETLINMDTLGGMPMIAASATYPMYVSKLKHRLEQLEFQNAHGCHNLYVGMQANEIVPKCGKPDMRKSSGSDLRWDTGLRVQISNGVVTEVTRR